jgi:lipopolysaccharide O-acetyltransferase
MNMLYFLANLPERVRTRVRALIWRRVLQVPDLQLQAGAQILGYRHMRIGRGFRAGRMLWLEAVEDYFGQRLTPQLIIGERVSCSDGVHIACTNRVTIGNDVLVGSKVHITDHNHGNYNGVALHSSPDEPPVKRALTGKPVNIGDRVFLADGVVVLAGSSIGAGTIVGANAVVSSRLPPDSICVGSPAQPIKHFDRKTLAWTAIEPGATVPVNDLLRARDAWAPDSESTQ